MGLSLIVITFLVIMSFAAVFLFRQLMPHDDDPAVNHASRTPVPAQTETAYYDEPRSNKARPGKGITVMPLIILATAGYFIYTNQDLIAEKMPAAVTELTREKQKEAISVANVDGHAVVDGVNWIKIVATSTSGIPFEGWVSELAIQKQSPKENKTADEFAKKLGLPTNKERLDGIKSLRKVSDALGSALNRPNRN
ncbi:MAG: hypothetical protein KKB51_03150 [Candidatus Riflebacteria bacterium]|nr:hypothetical protein [Candidatus Riflebacteria bacterium]